MIANANGYKILLCSTDNDPRREVQLLRSLSELSIDGLLLTSTPATPAQRYAEILSTLKIPIIFLDRTIQTLPYSSLTYNHRKGAYLATKYLLDLGHRKIACLTGMKSDHISSAQRISGYHWAMKDAGITVPQHYIFDGDYTFASGYRHAPAILKNGFTAVFSSNDMMAYGIYKYMNEFGINIPKDLSIVGFDGNEFSSLIYPPLTTVSQSATMLGQEATKLLMLEINNASLAHQSIYFDPELVIRESAAPYARKTEGDARQENKNL